MRNPENLGFRLDLIDLTGTCFTELGDHIQNESKSILPEGVVEVSQFESQFWVMQG